MENSNTQTLKNWRYKLPSINIYFTGYIYPKFKIMKNAITDFIEVKGTESFKADENKLFDYPILMVVGGVQKELFIQDVVKTHKDNVHVLEVVLLNRELGSIYSIRKECIAPPECVIDWDNVHCATTINQITQRS